MHGHPQEINFIKIILIIFKPLFKQNQLKTLRDLEIAILQNLSRILQLNFRNLKLTVFKIDAGT